MKNKGKKQKNVQQASHKRTNDDSLKLGDLVKGDIMEQLRKTQKQLADEESAKKEAEEAKKKEERRLKEKNKSFEELLNESGMDWRKFK
ncbi:YqkE family protein [Peribacillus sp. SCS-155]|uniref:YqkE family protein n=1 Tax=Peribacillus sedimenti TaxID=3115297 RepID=UPI0039059727